MKTPCRLAKMLTSTSRWGGMLRTPLSPLPQPPPRSLNAGIKRDRLAPQAFNRRRFRRRTVSGVALADEDDGEASVSSEQQQTNRNQQQEIHLRQPAAQAAV